MADSRYNAILCNSKDGSVATACSKQLQKTLLQNVINARARLKCSTRNSIVRALRKNSFSLQFHLFRHPELRGVQLLQSNYHRPLLWYLGTLFPMHVHSRPLWCAFGRQLHSETTILKNILLTTHSCNTLSWKMSKFVHSNKNGDKLVAIVYGSFFWVSSSNTLVLKISYLHTLLPRLHMGTCI